MKTQATSLLAALMMCTTTLAARTPENNPGKSESAWLNQQVRLTVCERLQAHPQSLPHYALPNQATLHLEVLANGEIVVLGTTAGDERVDQWIVSALQGVRCTDACNGTTFLLTVRFK